MSRTNGNIRAFFKPVQPAKSTPSPVVIQPVISTSQTKVIISKPPPIELSSTDHTPSVSLASKTVVGAGATAPEALDRRVYSSSWSQTQDSSLKQQSVQSPPSTSVQLPPISNTGPAGRVVRSSDDEEDSDSSLEDLATLLQYKSSNNLPSQPVINRVGPSTPRASRFKKNFSNFHTSPLTVQPKYKFDMKSLVTHAERDAATEESSKRVKAMLAPRLEVVESATLSDGGDDIDLEFEHGELLESLVAEREDGGMQKVMGALKRTEATVADKRWYFFDSQFKSDNIERQPFPTPSVSMKWLANLVDPQVRYQTFISGFAEDMVALRRNLPDEILLWILDEVCFESSDILRSSYGSILTESSDHVRRLLVPSFIQRMFKNLGGSSFATTVTQKVIPSTGVVYPRTNDNWAKHCSVIKFLGQIAKDLEQKSRNHILCMLLRMCIDHAVCENVDLFYSVQEAISCLCLSTPDDDWESCCYEICAMLFNSVAEPIFRLQMVHCIPSTSPLTHELRRRLAMSFYFDNLSYSLQPSHLTMDLDLFIKRLEDAEFDTTPETDYRDLSALISLLDIAVDDGQSAKLDLMDLRTEERFNNDIEAFGASIKGIMRSIGNPGAAFISRIEAKEVLELVGQRIAGTLRSKPKPKQSVFDGPSRKMTENLERERSAMQRFLS